MHFSLRLWVWIQRNSLPRRGIRLGTRRIYPYRGSWLCTPEANHASLESDAAGTTRMSRTPADYLLGTQTGRVSSEPSGFPRAIGPKPRGCFRRPSTTCGVRWMAEVCHDAAPAATLLIRCALVHYQFRRSGHFSTVTHDSGVCSIILCLVALGRLPLTGGVKPRPRCRGGAQKR